MKNEKNNFFNAIKTKSSLNISLTDQIADVLDISYDAAYRRIKDKTILSFNEAIKLAKHFKISLDKLYALDDDNFFVLKRNHKSTEKGFLDYFDYGIKFLNTLSKRENTDLLYAAKDIPLYYTLKDSLYSKFNFYLYLNILSDRSNNKKIIKLKDFKPSSKLVEKQEEFIRTCKKVTTVEIWNDTTINSKLYQIYYFFEIKIISKKGALQLCDELKIIIKGIEKQAKLELWNKEKNLEYEMFYNKIINLNNTIFLRSEQLRTLLVPYTTLSYFSLDDKETGLEIEEYFKRILKYSKKISGDAEIDRSLFFSSMYQKIEKLKQQINIKSSITFL